MAYPSIFNSSTTESILTRISKLTATTPAKWGKMNVGQMMAHCTVPYEQIFGENTDRPPLLMRLMVQLFFKKGIVNDVPYKQNLPTAPSFVKAETYDFEREKSRLINYIKNVEKMGEEAFEGMKSNSLGTLKAIEWNNLLYKHLDHHLKQFGV